METTNTRVSGNINPNSPLFIFHPLYQSPLGKVFCKQCDSEMELWYNPVNSQLEYICYNDKTRYILECV